MKVGRTATFLGAGSPTFISKFLNDSAFYYALWLTENCCRLTYGLDFLIPLHHSNWVSKVKALILDIGTVLIRLDFSEIMRLRNLGTSDLETSLQKMDEWPSYDQFERGQLDETAFFQEVEAHLRVPILRSELFKIWNSVLKETVSGVPELLSQLSKNIPIYALTNSNPTHITYAHLHYPWMQTFKQTFTSYALKARKPEREIYQKVTELIQTSAPDILFIDDRIENVLGARAVGWTAEVCSNSPSDLVEILQKYHLLTPP